MHWFRDPTGPPAQILVVCTGNVCRSPYIAAMLRAALPDLTIRTAGTGALVGSPPDAEVLQALSQRGVHPEPESARQLTRCMVREAVLIVTATRLQRARVLEIDSGAAAFTLKELARFAEADIPVKGLQAVVERAAAMAQIVESVDHDDDLDDPHGLEPAAYEQMARDVDAALSRLVPALQTA